MPIAQIVQEKNLYQTDFAETLLSGASAPLLVAPTLFGSIAKDDVPEGWQERD